MTARDGTVAWPLNRAATLYPDRIGVLEDGHVVAYHELAERVARLRGGLADLGARPGDVVAILAENSCAHLEACIGIPSAGMIANDLNFRLAADELHFILGDSGATIILTDDAHLDTALELQHRRNRISTVIHDGQHAVPPGGVSYRDLLGADPRPAADLGSHEPAAISYTGGTTGLPKGVTLTHRNLLDNAKHVLIATGHTEIDRYLHAAPMFHAADSSQTLALTWVGGTHVIIPRFEPSTFLDAVERHRVTLALLVPTMLRGLLDESTIRSRDLASLRLMMYGASPMPSELLSGAMDVLECGWAQLYGMTEAAPVVTCLTPEDHRRGAAGEDEFRPRLRSAGRPVVGVEIEVRTDDGKTAEPGERGEVHVRGPNMMRGYWNRPAETAAAHTADGWYRTGDVGYLDRDGYLYLVDRAKDMIISGGENVYSAEVEQALYEHPGVAEAAVIGVPDERWGERVHAIVVARADQTLSADELQAHCRSRIAGYKTPRTVEVRTEPLPKSGAGKILKRELRTAPRPTQEP